jgi:hypothetical protein
MILEADSLFVLSTLSQSLPDSIVINDIPESDEPSIDESDAGRQIDINISDS